MTVKAVIVGIEKYGGALDEVVSPAANALSIAKWAIAHGFRHDDVFLFIAAVDQNVDNQIQQLGLQNRGTTLRDIENVLRTDLAGAATGGINPGSSLLFYWSGHGMTDSNGHRLFFCSDYTELLADRIFNASLFFRDLRGDLYEGYRTMLALADVCGANKQLRVRPAYYTPDQPHKRNHLVYFATPEGGYARAATGEGAFTYSALSALKTFDSFPDLALFKIQLEHELNKTGLPRFLLDAHSEDHVWERRFGEAEPSADMRADSLIDLLVDLGVHNADAERAYRATAWTIKNSRLSAPAGITGMVRELSALHASDKQAPGGLVQYVLRLCQAVPATRDNLMAWLARYAGRGTIIDEQHTIEQTSGASLLIIEVLADKDGKIHELAPRLRTRDTTDSVGPRLEKIGISDLYSVDEALKDLLRRLTADGLNDLEIHFLIDATVFDYPFHRLPSLIENNSLGETFGVVLHHRERFQKAFTPAKRFWLSRAKKVSAVLPIDLSWTRCMQGQTLPTDADLCLVSWLPSGPGKKMLSRLLDLGVPYLYWPHEDGEPDPEPGLTEVVRSIQTHTGIADAMLKKRIADTTTSGSMLWDDVDFKP